MRTAAPMILSLAIGLVPPTTRQDDAPRHVGRLDPAVRESSGLAASRARAGVLWTHNDSGGAAELFAVKPDGTLIGRWPVGAPNVDWEDLAIDGDGRLYVADVGNNGAARREVYVHAVVEPDVAGAARDPLRIEHTWTLRYPDDRPFDAEALVVLGGRAYVIPKLVGLGRVPLYAFDLDPGRPAQTLARAGDLPIRFPVTAADVSADGKWLAVLTVAGPFLLEINGDVPGATKAQPRRVTHGHIKQEACAVTADGVVVTNEDRDVLLFRWADFGL